MFLKIFLFISWLCWVFFAVHRSSPIARERGLLFSCPEWASHCCGFSCGERASVIAAPGLSHTGSAVAMHRLSYSEQTGSLPLASPEKPPGAHTYQLSPPEWLLLVFLDPQSWPGLQGVSLPSSPGHVALVQTKSVLVRILQRNRINRIWINRERGLILRNWLMP